MSKLLSKCSDEQFWDVSMEWRNFAQVFWSLSEIIGLLAWIFWHFFFKTAAYGCSGRLWGFLGGKSNCLNVFGLWAKVTVFWQKIYGRLLKVNFECPQQKFEKKNDWSKLYYYHFSRTLNEFFSDSDRKK